MAGNCLKFHVGDLHVRDGICESALGEPILHESDGVWGTSSLGGRTQHIEINHLTGVTQVTFHGLETEQLLTKAEC